MIITACPNHVTLCNVCMSALITHREKSSILKWKLCTFPFEMEKFSILKWKNVPF